MTEAVYPVELDDEDAPEVTPPEGAASRWQDDRPPGMTKSEHLRRRIVWHLRHEPAWRCSFNDGNTWRGWERLAADLGEPQRCVKREVRRLARSGALRYEFMINDEGYLAGAGYFLDFAWDRHQPGREEDPAEEEFEVLAEEEVW